MPLQVGVRITSKSKKRISSDKYAAKTHKVLPVELLQLNSGYNTDQDRFSVARRDFNVRYENPKQGYRRIYTEVKPSNNYARSLSKREVSKTISVVKFDFF